MRHHQRSPSRRLVGKLAAYSASAAVLVASEAEAAIIHTDLGPDGIRVFDGLYHIDLDSDGHMDVSLRHAYYDSSSEKDLVTAGGRIIGAPNSSGNGFLAKAFDYGELIEPGSPTSGGARLAYRTETPSSEFSFTGGDFVGLHRAYLGITFQSEDNSPHMGWIEVDAYLAERLRIYGYAYETTPGKAISAGAVPEPPALVLLAAGAAGLGMLRRKRAISEQN